MGGGTLSQSGNRAEPENIINLRHLRHFQFTAREQLALASLRDERKAHSLGLLPQMRAKGAR